MRGQRAFNEFHITREQRLPIARSNIVCAEPMPGEAAFLDEFIAEQLSDDAEGRFLASLVRKVFEAMKLAGEAGSLLKIEEDIAEEVAKAKKQWLERPEFKQKTLFATGPQTVQKELALTRGITDESFWGEAEQRIYDSLRAYAERAELSGGFQRRLFAVDAARGFAFIDLCRERYDVALMNPPFGLMADEVSRYVENRYPDAYVDIYASFLERGIQKTTGGYVGAITSRSFLTSSKLKRFRAKRLLLGADVVADLGNGVMDDAFVEACAFVTRCSAEADSKILSTDVVFGRWDVRFATQSNEPPVLSSPFERLPRSQPGALLIVPEDYPLRIPDIGAIVDDESDDEDIVRHIRRVLHSVWGESADTYEEELCQMLGPKGLRAFIRKSFFSEHVKQYSRSRRKAPIYWQLATPSASYSIWLYYHRFTKDTFFKVLNEYVKPKREHERQKLERGRSEAGAEPTRSQRKEIEDQEKFVAELAAMAEEVARIAPLWNPNLNDGVIINFAPLWRLVPQNKSWQKECKACWDKLVKGDYDWAHLAMHLWPERVVPKCVTDASLAIAHGLEESFWEQDERDRFQPKEKPDGGWQPVIDRLVKQRTSPAVKAALKSLTEAPAPMGSGKKRKR